jgi:Novel toxin 15
VTRDAKARRQAQQARRYSEELDQRGLDPADAKRLGAAKAAREHRNLDALHNQDLVAGGSDAIGSLNAQGQRVAGDADFGFSDTNRHIGSQWNGERIKSIDAEACNMSNDGKGSEKLNVQLRPCGKHEARAAGCRQKRRRP